ncbi:Putative oxidoreductase component of anaerobic dehydrogenases; Chaperone protein TorD [Halorubrum sp. DM2]|nr:Putative oxidoreductase component of anaerobic dehydrogenases; Chaperone protein TorD [Halorubrum sp. DM2]
MGEVIAEAAAAVVGDDADGGDARSELLDAAVAVTDRLPDDPRDLERTFARTFGVETDGKVDRYEVAYAPGGVTVNTDRMADAAGFYRAFGLENADSSRDRADAVSVQLEFRSHLAAKRAYLRETGDETGVERVTDATAAFVEDHVGRWCRGSRPTSARRPTGGRSRRSRTRWRRSSTPKASASASLLRCSRRSRTVPSRA